MHRSPLSLEWKDAQGEYNISQLHPIDLITRKEGEFLVAHTRKQQEIEIRLDKISKYSVA